MTSNYDEFYDRFLSPSEVEEGEADCFEILSAYIDGEATAEECKQVQNWLDNDPEIKKTYLQLLKLQEQMHSIPAPVSKISTEQLTEQVFTKIDRRSQRKRVAIWGSAVAAAIVGAVVSIVPHSSTPSFRFADNDSPQINSRPVKVAVSLDKPTVIIPKAAVSNSSRTRRI